LLLPLQSVVLSGTERQFSNLKKLCIKINECLLKHYEKENPMPEFTTANIPPQHHKTALITGTGGLGYETALALANAGATVILAGRNQSKGNSAIQQIRRAVPPAKITFAQVDLASLASIHTFAQTLLDQNKPLDLLINNAGVMSPPQRQTTVDNFEIQFGTNHLGHFALTALLLPLLRLAPAPRVVNVSSLAHRGGSIHFDDLQFERKYKPWPAYQQSKLANLLFTRELQRRSDLHHWGLTVNAAHPGYSRTDLIDNGPGAGNPFFRLSRALLEPRFSHSAAAGALPTLFAAISPAAQPNGYYGPQGLYEMKGPAAPAYIAPRAKDDAAAKRLWDISEQLTGTRFTQSTAPLPPA
jgi:NAD(P)-dependent dehydrogenase (short-subunit alcohol dehydrogenase family)